MPHLAAFPSGKGGPEGVGKGSLVRLPDKHHDVSKESRTSAENDALFARPCLRTTLSVTLRVPPLP